MICFPVLHNPVARKVVRVGCVGVCTQLPASTVAHFLDLNKDIIFQSLRGTVNNITRLTMSHISFELL